MRITSLILLLAAHSSPAWSQVIPGQDLWGGLKTGISKAEFKAIYPSKKVDLSAGCVVTIDPYFERKSLAQIDLVFDTSSTSQNCASTVSVSLASKYGDYRTEKYRTELFDYSCSGKFMCAIRDAAVAMGADKPKRYVIRTWFTGTTLVTFTRLEESENDFTVSYNQAKAATPDAVNKL